MVRRRTIQKVATLVTIRERETEAKGCGCHREYEQSFFFQIWQAELILQTRQSQLDAQDIQVRPC